MEAQHTTGHFKGDSGLQLFYQCWRPTGISRAILVFIHGIGEHSDRYQFPVAYFTNREFTVYTMDLRGHGNSEGRRAYADSLEQLIEDISSLLTNYAF